MLEHPEGQGRNRPEPFVFPPPRLSLSCFLLLATQDMKIGKKKFGVLEINRTRSAGNGLRQEYTRAWNTAGASLFIASALRQTCVTHFGPPHQEDRGAMNTNFSLERAASPERVKS